MTRPDKTLNDRTHKPSSDSESVLVFKRLHGPERYPDALAPFGSVLIVCVLVIFCRRRYHEDFTHVGFRCQMASQTCSTIRLRSPGPEAWSRKSSTKAIPWR